mgnify:CR=1 FL=1
MTINLPHVHSGKVRDIYEIDSEKLLMVTSDRLSAFDVVLNEPIPEKGRVLTAMTKYWLSQLNNLVPNHLLSVDPMDLGSEINLDNREFLLGRTMICKRAEMLPVECIVRGFITGSAWKEYKDKGTVHGEKVVSGLRESEQFKQPLFTPSTKATSGHDENISFLEAVEILGSDSFYSRDIGLCLLGLNPQNQTKVVEKHMQFSAKGGKFASIFPGTNLDLEKLI